MKHLDLFSGIGGFSLAVDWAFQDVEHIFCEIDPFCQQVLKKHWPDSKIYDDIKKLTGIGTVDLVTGGFPCQPFSQAGKRRGTEDDRYLWPAMFRVIQATKPTWVIAENVGGLVTWNNGMVLDQVLSDLEGEWFEIQPFVIPACAVNAPHRRDRIWIVGYSEYNGQHGTKNKKSDLERDNRNQKGEDEIRKSKRTDSLWSDVADSQYERSIQCKPQEQSRSEERLFTRNNSNAKDPICQRSSGGVESERQVLGSRFPEAKNAGPSWETNWIEVATCFCDVDDGLSRRLVRLSDGRTISRAKWRQEALKAGGNAIVPQVAYEILKLMI